MSDIQTPTKTEGGKGSAWSEAERTELLLRIIVQLTSTNKINWKEISMNGRTAKSIEGQWTKFKVALNQIKEGSLVVVAPTSTPKRTPSAKSSKKKAASKDFKLESIEEPNTPTPKRKASVDKEGEASPSKKAKDEVKPEFESDEE